MTYLTMFLKESLRLYPPVPVIGRELERPLKMKTDLKSKTESTLPPGSVVSLAIMGLHKNPLVWEDPDVSYYDNVFFKYNNYIQLQIQITLSKCENLCQKVINNSWLY